MPAPFHSPYINWQKTSWTKSFYLWSGLTQALECILLNFWPVVLYIYTDLYMLALSQMSKDLILRVPTLEISRNLHGRLVRSLNKFIGLFELLIILPLCSTLIHFLTELNIVLAGYQTIFANVGSGLFIVQDLTMVLVLILLGEKMGKMVAKLDTFKYLGIKELQIFINWIPSSIYKLKNSPNIDYMSWNLQGSITTTTASSACSGVL